MTQWPVVPIVYSHSRRLHDQHVSNLNVGSSLSEDRLSKYPVNIAFKVDVSKLCTIATNAFD